MNIVFNISCILFAFMGFFIYFCHHITNMVTCMNAKTRRHIKHLLALGFGLIFLICSFNIYKTNVVTITSDIPDVVQPGTTITVTITINKGNIEGFGRFTNTLPKGFTATSSDPNFSFNDNTVTILWVKLPKSPTFTVSYDIVIPEKVKTSFPFNGKFGYVQNNEKRFADLSPKLIRVTSCGAAQGHDDNVRQTNYEAVTCYRTIGFIDDEATVSVRINKSDITAMCKIEEMIPEGYMFSSVDNAGSEYSAFENVARFMWTKSPSDQVFSVVYKVKAKPGYNIKDLNINGAFTAFDAKGDKSFIILDKDARIDESTGKQSRYGSDNHLLDTKEGVRGRYASTNSAQTLKDFKFSSEQTTFFANTNAVNTLYRTFTPTTQTNTAATNNVNAEKTTMTTASTTSTTPSATKTTTTSSSTTTTSTNTASTATKTTTASTATATNSATKTTSATKNTSTTPATKPTTTSTSVASQTTTKPTTTTATKTTTASATTKPAATSTSTATKTATNSSSAKTGTTTASSTTTTTSTAARPSTASTTKTSSTTTRPSTTSTAKTSPSPRTNTTSTSAKTSTAQTQTKTNSSANTTNVRFRIQVAATQKMLQNSKVYFAKRNINQPVAVEHIGNMYKYTIENYETYLQARNRRNEVWEKTPIKGAFIVAYNGKQRITVQEALMITKQKWVK